MKVPPYFKQQKHATCSLAVLRMVLAMKEINVSEETLVEKVKDDYGANFKNIWNPTIAKISQEYKINTTMYAKWPLFKEENMKSALKEYITSPRTFDANKYENPDDKDDLEEPLPLAYKEMFEAVKIGCKYVYGELNKDLLSSTLSKSLIQTSIKLKDLYPTKYTKGYHSILLYNLKGEIITYHDPYNGEALQTSIDVLMKAATDVGAFMVYDI